MEKPKEQTCKKPRPWHRGGSGGWGWTYFLAMIGTAVYYVQQSSGFWEGVVGVLKALVWPAMVMYRVMGLLNG
jgi:hypothetical protein